MLNKSFLRKVSRFVSSHDLLNRSDKYLIALSGGADSVAMALALKDSDTMSRLLIVIFVCVVRSHTVTKGFVSGFVKTMA